MTTQNKDEFSEKVLLVRTEECSRDEYSFRLEIFQDLKAEFGYEAVLYYRENHEGAWKYKRQTPISGDLIDDPAKAAGIGWLKFYSEIKDFGKP